MNQKFTPLDPIAETITLAHELYMPRLFSSAELISCSMFAAAIAGAEIVKADPELAPSAFFDAYARRFKAHEDIMNHVDSSSFKADLETSWLIVRTPDKLWSGLSKTVLATIMVRDFENWRQREGMSDLQLLDHLAILKVAISLAAAGPGAELSSLKDDYCSTRAQFTSGISKKDVTRLEQQHFGMCDPFAIVPIG